VLVLEREAAPQFCIGETLPGAAGPLLRDLGLLPGFCARGYPRSLGRASIWGSGELVRADSFADPQGPGWRLDRRDFEAWLVAEAQRGGAAVVRSCRLTAVRRADNSSHPWSIALCLRARRPANGRGTISRRCDRQTSGDRPPSRRDGNPHRPAGLLLCAAPGRPPSDLDRFSIVEAVPNGWFYGARLPSGARLVAYHTDSDLASKGSWRREFADLVAGTVIARALHMDEAPRPSPPPPARVAAWSGYSSACTGDGWAAVGDAACCFDPLSSQGLFNALYGALQPQSTAGARILMKKLTLS
jgi:hypothetical protein